MKTLFDYLMLIWRRDPKWLAMLGVLAAVMVAHDLLEREMAKNTARETALEVASDATEPYVKVAQIVPEFEPPDTITIDVIYVKAESCDELLIEPDVKRQTEPFWRSLPVISRKGDVAPPTNSEPRRGQIRFKVGEQRLPPGWYQFRVKSFCKRGGEWLVPPFERVADVMFHVPSELNGF